VYKGAPDIGDYFDMNGIILLSDEFEVSEDIPEFVLGDDVRLIQIVTNLIFF